MSPAPDNTLDDPKQIIADLQHQLADAQQRLEERTAERDQAQAQQAAAAEVLQVINSTPGDLAPVFDAILERAHTLCGVAYGSLQVYDGERFQAVAVRGLPEELADRLRQGYRGSDTPASRPLVEGESLVQIPDLAAIDHPMARRAVELAGMRTLLSIALRKDKLLIGLIIAGRQEVRPFLEKEIALLQNFAAQAVIAMENARLITETREALEQQTATAEVLGVINSSPGDLAPVFDAMLDKALQLCGAAFGILHTIDGQRSHIAAHRGVSPTFAEFLTGRPHEFSKTGPGLIGHLLRGERVIHHDAAESEGYRSGAPIARALVELEGGRSVLAVPLSKDNALLGMFVIYRREVRPFSDKQITLLENFAAQAVIAMENARLINETREALDQQTATAEVLQVINSSPGDLAPVFDAMLEKATRLCEAPYGQLATYDGEFFRFVAVHGYTPFVEQQAREPVSPSFGVTWPRLVSGERVVHMPDVVDTDIYRSGHERARRFVEVGGGRTLLTVALCKDDVLLGALSIYRQEVRPFSDKEIALLQSFAAQAVIAMENARLITETREALEQQTATADILQVINSSPGDLVPVFGAILDKAHSLCEAAFGTLMVRDGDRFRAAVLHGVPAPFEEVLRRDFKPRPGTPLARLMSGERLIHIPDLAEVAALWPDDSVPRAGVELGGTRTLLMVPLVREDELLGAISAYRQEVRPFSDKQIALLQNFAGQAVIAMENARLITETREALEQQTATAEVLGVINSSPGDLAPVFDAILEKSHTLCDAATGSLRIIDGDMIRAVAFRGQSGEFADRVQQGYPFASAPLLASLRDGAPFVHISDVAERDDSISRLSAASGNRTILAVPLRKDDALLGMIVAGRKEVRPFTDKQIGLLRNFAAQAVIAMENARLLDELRQRTDEVAELNRGLEARVAEQVDELGRVGRLKRFLAPQLAELIVSQGDEKILESHRREIVVVFCDLRGYTAFTETAEPEEVLDFLRQYHGALGPLVSQFEGTLDQFSGDGIMVFFNDPVPCADPAERAVKMAMAMREAARELIAAWSRHGCELGFGIGIAQGYATLGQIGFSERSGYTAIGTVCNLAARLCAEAQDGQILVSSRVASAVEAVARLEDLGNLELKGLRRPVAAFNVVQSTSQAEGRPNLTVIARGPGP